MECVILSSESPNWIGVSAIELSVLMLASALTLLLVRLGGKHGPMDLPSESKIHTLPTPRSGGIAILASLILGCVLYNLFVDKMQMRFLFFLLPTLLIFAIGLIDDLLGLGARLKLVLICVSASAVTMQLPGVPVGSAIILFSVMVLLTNAVNLLDGANGLAGGVMSLSFVALGTLFFLHDDCSIAAVCFLAVPAIFGFLILNLGGRIFMGDCGSLMLGFLAATAVVRAYPCGIRVALGAIVCTAVPLLDLCFVVGRRIHLGVPVLSGDLNHGYNVLLRRMGSLRLVLAVYYIATILSAVCGLLIAGG